MADPNDIISNVLNSVASQTPDNGGNPASRQNPDRMRPSGAPAPILTNGPTTSLLAKNDPKNQYISSGRQTVFGLNYNGTIDQQDNGIGAFIDPGTGRPYNTRDSKLAGASLNTGVFSGSIGSPYDKNIQNAVSQGKYRVQVTTKNGQSAILPIVDNGPALWTGNAVDLTKGAADLLGIKDNSIVNYQILGPDGQPMAIKNAPGVPSVANPSGQTRGQMYQSVLADYYKQRAQFSPGIKPASPDDYAKFRYAVDNNLIDLDKVPFSERLSMAVAADPTFLLKPENLPILRDYVVKKAPGVMESLSQAFNGLPQATSDMLNSVKDAALAAGDNAKNFGEMVWNATVHGALPGAPEAPQPDMATVYKNAATGIQGTVRGVGDAYNMLEGFPSFVDRIGLPIALHFTQDPTKREEILTNYTRDLQNTLRYQINTVTTGKAVQDTVVNVFKAMGVATAADGLANAKPDPSTTEGVSMLTNPAQYIPFGEGVTLARAAGTSFFEKTLGALKQATVDAASAGGVKAVSETAADRLTGFLKDPLPNPPGGVGGPDVANVIGSAQTDATKAAQTVSVADRDAANATAQVTKFLNGSNGLNTLVGRAIQGLGVGTATLGSGAENVLKFPDYLAGKLVPDNPIVQHRVAQAMRWAIQDIPGAIVGGPHGVVAGLLGSVTGAVTIESLPEALKATSEFLKTAGRELTYGKATLPFWNRVATELDGVPSQVAKALDHSLVYSIPAVMKGAVSGVLTGALMGGASNPANPFAGMAQGMAQGALFGMAGGGFGQMIRYKNPAEFGLETRGDWKKYRDVLSTPDRQNFDRLSVTDQLALSQYQHHQPGLNVNYTDDPNDVWGQHYGNTITINHAAPGSVVRGIMAHELAHSVAEDGQLPQLYDELLGNPAAKKAGMYTLRNSSAPDGVAEVDPNTGRYKTNADFQNLKNRYVQALADKNRPTSGISDLDIGKEIFAEHGADYFTSGQSFVDARSAFRPGWASNTAAQKSALMKMGFLFDSGGNAIRGAGAFGDLTVRPNDALNNILKTYVQTKFREGNISERGEEVPERGFTSEDLRGNHNLVDHWFDGSSSILRDKTGQIQFDSAGNPILRRDADVKKYNAGFVRDVEGYLKGLTEDQRNELGFQQKGDNWQMRYMPDHLIDHLASQNQYNPNQLENLRALSKQLSDARQNGRVWNFFYQTATSGFKKAYAALAGTSKAIVPYMFEKTGADNVNVKGIDFAQLTNNYLRLKDHPVLKGLWQTPNEFANDAHTYFTNHANGRAGAEGIGIQKRDAINALLGIGHSGVTENRELNPFVSQIPKVRSVIKSYRIDRLNRLTPTDAFQPFTGEAQYQQYMKPNFLPGNAERWQKNNGASSMPKGSGFVELMGGGEKVFAKPGDVSSISERSKGYLNPTQQNQMAAMLAGGHIDRLANKLIKEYNNVWSKSDIAMSAKDWYSRMAPMLNKYFKGNSEDADMFARLLSVTSPQTNPKENFQYALEALTRYKEGEFDSQIRDYQQRKAAGESFGSHYPQELKPMRDNAKLYGKNSDAVIRVLAGDWDSGGPKTPQFKDNILGIDHGATIDLWAARTVARLLGAKLEGLPKGFVDEAAPSNLEFAIGQHAFAKAAEKLGLTPDQLQAIAWYGEKEFYGKMGWGKTPDFGSYHANMKAELNRVKSGQPYLWEDPNRPGFRGHPRDLIYRPSKGMLPAAVQQALAAQKK